MIEQDFSTQITKTTQLRYLLYYPPDYDETQKWPLVLFLHGSGERSDDNLELVKKYGIPRHINDGQDFPSLIVAPQCPLKSHWLMEIDSLIALLDDLETKLPIDKNRIYLTGLSMGGHATWMLAAAQPERFAALVPVAAFGQPEQATLLKDIPTWIFHGAKDNIVPIRRSLEMYEALKAIGSANLRLMTYEESGHEVCSLAYERPELYTWLFEQKRRENHGKI